MSHASHHKAPVLSTLNADGTRRWLNPKPSHGRTWKARMWVGWGLIALFGVMPWLRVGGAPALLLDVGARRFYVLGARLAPSDTIALMVTVLVGLLAVFLITALVGRAWCGYACPQTVYLELVFRPLDRLLGKKSWLGQRWPLWATRALRGALYLALALYLAHTFLAYFVGVDVLALWLGQSPARHPVPFLVMAATTGLILFDFGYFREQMCTVACPYARLQSVLLDKDSLVVGYDATRGEPRGKRSSTGAKGDCIDCRACVLTCPTGIDIRQGLQLECIACAQCVDACDAIMDRIAKPRGLVRYASQRRLEEASPTRLVRPRPILYASLLVLIASLGAVWLARREPVEILVVRDGGVLYERTSDGRIRNNLRLRITNLADEPRDYVVSLREPGEVLSDELPLTVPASLRRDARFALVARETAFKNGIYDVTLDVQSAGLSQRVRYRLVGPVVPTEQGGSP